LLVTLAEKGVRGMSVLIEGMKMPKNRGVFVCVLPDGTAIIQGDIVTQTTAIEIPPHGRLIDAVALKKESHYDDYDVCIVDADDIDNAPTIIPAEEGR